MLDIENYLDKLNKEIMQFYSQNCKVNNKLLSEAVEYCLFGGKGIRAALVVLTGESFSCSKDKLLAPALAVEMIHAYSLVHDDLPAMDNDALRRGKPSCHVQFGEANAILVGDALQTLAFSVIANSCLDDSVKVKMIKELSNGSGANGMISGQLMDIEATGKIIDYDNLCSIHEHKTGALIRSSVLLGAYSAGCNTKDIKHLDIFASNIGMAFQIYDDLLDVIQDTEVLGKPAKSDVELNKATFPSLLGIPKTRELASMHTDSAIKHLKESSAKHEGLASLVRYLIKRDF